MPLTAQALTTMANARLYLNLFTFTSVTSSETLTTSAITYNFANTDISPNSFGTFAEVSGTASDTVSTAVMTIDYPLGTVTFSASRTGDITISSYDYFAWDFSQDKFIERNINSASSLVSKYCNRLFIKDTYDEFYPGTGRQRLVLEQYPINTITSVSENSAALTAGIDYVTSNSTLLDEGIIFKEDGWTWFGFLIGLVGEPTAPINNIEVIYSSGFTLEPETERNLPFDLEDVVLSITADAFNEQQRATVGLKQLTQGKLTYVWDTAAVVKQYSGVLDAYKKGVF